MEKTIEEKEAIEYQAGYEYGIDQPQGIQQDMLADIPDGDYTAIVAEHGYGPESPRNYWKGYNAAISEAAN